MDFGYCSITLLNCSILGRNWNKSCEVQTTTKTDSMTKGECWAVISIVIIRSIIIKWFKSIVVLIKSTFFLKNWFLNSMHYLFSVTYVLYNSNIITTFKSNHKCNNFNWINGLTNYDKAIKTQHTHVHSKLHKKHGIQPKPESLNLDVKL